MDEQLIINDPVIAEDGPATFTGLPSLADQLTIQNSASIFYSYARDTSLSRLFDQQEMQYTLLAPTNRAVMALARKPYVDVLFIKLDCHGSNLEFPSIPKSV